MKDPLGRCDEVKERLQLIVGKFPGFEPDSLKLQPALVPLQLVRDALTVIEAQEKEIARRYLLTPDEKMLIDKLRAAGAARSKPSPERPFFGDRPRRG